MKAHQTVSNNFARRVFGIKAKRVFDGLNKTTYFARRVFGIKAKQPSRSVPDVRNFARRVFGIKAKRVITAAQNGIILPAAFLESRQSP